MAAPHEIGNGQARGRGVGLELIAAARRLTPAVFPGLHRGATNAVKFRLNV